MRFGWATLDGGSLARSAARFAVKHFAKRGFEFFLLPKQSPRPPGCRAGRDTHAGTPQRAPRKYRPAKRTGQAGQMGQAPENASGINRKPLGCTCI